MYKEFFGVVDFFKKFAEIEKKEQQGCVLHQVLEDNEVRREDEAQTTKTRSYLKYIDF